MDQLTKSKQTLNKSLSSQGQSSSATQNRGDIDSEYNNRNNMISQSNYTIKDKPGQNNNSKIGEWRQRRQSDSNISDTSAIIRMNQNIKKKILRNHLMLIILLNLVQVSALLYAIIWPVWYDDSNTDNNNDTGDKNQAAQDDGNIQYGLLLNFQGNNISTNGFQNENNREIGGISSFIMFCLGIFIQFIYIFQLFAFFKSYPQSIQNRGCKLLKFKTCRWLCLFLYLGAVSYWIIVVFLVQIVSDTTNFKQLQYGFWISIGCIASFMLICIYFNFVKKKIRKNDLVSNLLNANRFLKMDDESEVQEEY